MGFDGRSLASRAASVNEVLSDGYLSDSVMENGGKEGKKKKKGWKVCGGVRVYNVLMYEPVKVYDLVCACVCFVKLCDVWGCVLSDPPLV